LKTFCHQKLKNRDDKVDETVKSPNLEVSENGQDQGLQNPEE